MQEPTQQQMPQQQMSQQPQQGMQAPQLRGEDVQALLFSRIETLSPQEMQVLDSIITPETVPVLFKIFPELGILFDKGSQLQQGAGRQQMQRPQQQMSSIPVDPNLSRGLMG